MDAVKNQTLVALTKEQRITIPKEMLQELEWKPDDYVLIYQYGKKIILYKADVTPIRDDDEP